VNSFVLTRSQTCRQVGTNLVGNPKMRLALKANRSKLFLLGGDNKGMSGNGAHAIEIPKIVPDIFRAVKSSFFRNRLYRRFNPGRPGGRSISVGGVHTEHPLDTQALRERNLPQRAREEGPSHPEPLRSFFCTAGFPPQNTWSARRASSQRVSSWALKGRSRYLTKLPSRALLVRTR